MTIESIKYALLSLARQLDLKRNLESIEGCLKQLNKEFELHLVSDVNDVEVIVLLDNRVLVLFIYRNRLLVESEKDAFLDMVHDWLGDFPLTDSNDHCEFAIDAATLNGNV